MKTVESFGQIVRRLRAAANSDKGLTGQECWELEVSLTTLLDVIRDAARDITRAAR